MLAKCSFVYAMYPFEKKLHVFAETSLPTKLTTYVQAGRPIFAHCPAKSSLRQFINDTDTGVVWNGIDSNEGKEACEAIQSINVEKGIWENVRDTYFGENNLHTMRKVFNKN